MRDHSWKSLFPVSSLRGKLIHRSWEVACRFRTRAESPFDGVHVVFLLPPPRVPSSPCSHDSLSLSLSPAWLPSACPRLRCRLSASAVGFGCRLAGLSPLSDSSSDSSSCHPSPCHNCKQAAPPHASCEIMGMKMG
jgi:hypothetical protein